MIYISHRIYTQNRIMHTHQYKVPAGFENKRVLVVGFGNWAADVAVELARTAKQVFMSTRHGNWVVPRFSDGGKN